MYFFIRFTLLFAIGLSSSSNIATGQSGKPKSSEEYISILNNSKDSLYADILKEFDDYLKNHPEDVSTRIEKCVVINQAYYDSYEDYNPNYEEFEVCLNELVSDFPENQEVLLFKLRHIYGDEVIEFCDDIINKNRKNPGEWQDRDLSVFYESLARQYSYQADIGKTIHNAKIAEGLNDTLDLSLLLAEQYMALNNYDQAKVQLLRSLDADDAPWESVNKGNLLLKLGESEKALEAFRYAQNDTMVWIDNGVVAKALIENEMYAEARTYLLKDLDQAYNSTATLHQLFNYDFKHSPSDTTLATYNRLNTENFLNDAFGKYRLMMLARAPFDGWKITDVVKFLIFLLTVGLIIVAPYLWILPLYFVSRHFRIGGKPTSLHEARWGFRDFWIVSSAVLLIEFIAHLIFQYDGLLATFLDDYYIEEIENISLTQANFGLFFFTGMLLTVLVFIKKTDYGFLKAMNWSALKGIGIGIGLAILLRTIYFTLVRVGIMPGENASIIGSVQDYFASISSYYHPAVSFLFMVIFIPFYEEYLFRGLIMTSIERRIRFIGANLFQAILFTLMHDNLNLFFFYIAFGLIAGILVRKSKSIAPSIAFHMTNNFFAFIVLTRIS